MKQLSLGHARVGHVSNDLLQHNQIPHKLIQSLYEICASVKQRASVTSKMIDQTTTTTFVAEHNLEKLHVDTAGK